MRFDLKEFQVYAEYSRMTALVESRSGRFLSFVHVLSSLIESLYDCCRAARSQKFLQVCLLKWWISSVLALRDSVHRFVCDIPLITDAFHEGLESLRCHLKSMLTLIKAFIVHVAQPHPVIVISLFVAPYLFDYNIIVHAVIIITRKTTVILQIRRL